MKTVTGERSQNLRSPSDAVIDGLAAGFWAGALMMLILLAGVLILGASPVKLLADFAPGVNPSIFTGLLVHLGVSVMYGMGFGLGIYFLSKLFNHKISPTFLGIIYGLLVFLLAEQVILPEISSALLLIPTWLFALAHLAYGIFLGWQFGRKW